jgi:hypothetical protein
MNLLYTKTPQGKLNYMYYEMELIIYDTKPINACLVRNYKIKRIGYSVAVTH